MARTSIGSSVGMRSYSMCSFAGSVALVAALLGGRLLGEGDNVGAARLLLDPGDRVVEVEYHSFELSPDTPVDFEGDEVDFLAKHKRMPVEQVRQLELVALGRQPPVDGAGADRHQRLALRAEGAQHLHVLGVAQAALDEADVAAAHGLEVGERRAVELDAVEQFEQPLVDVEERHVAA